MVANNLSHTCLPYYIYRILPSPFLQSGAIQVARQLSLTTSQRLSIKWNILEALQSLFPFSTEEGVNQRTLVNAEGREEGPGRWDMKDDYF